MARRGRCCHGERWRRERGRCHGSLTVSTEAHPRNADVLGMSMVSGQRAARRRSDRALRRRNSMPSRPRGRPCAGRACNGEGAPSVDARTLGSGAGRSAGQRPESAGAGERPVGADGGRPRRPDGSQSAASADREVDDQAAASRVLVRSHGASSDRHSRRPPVGEEVVALMLRLPRAWQRHPPRRAVAMRSCRSRRSLLNLAQSTRSAFRSSWATHAMRLRPAPHASRWCSA